MRILNLDEFGEYCSRIKHPCYVFSTENQSWSAASIHISLKFDRMQTTLKPNRISLINDGGRLTMKNVKHVQVYDDIESIGIQVNIICEENHEDITYTILID